MLFRSIDVFDTNGNFLRRLVTGGNLNLPWGMAIAPDDFGRFSNALLVGNVASGNIFAYNPHTGAFRGQLTLTNGNPFTEPGLWSLKFGNDGLAGSSHTLFFTAGINGYADGLLGSLQAVPETNEGDDSEMGGADAARLAPSVAGILAPSAPSTTGAATVVGPTAPSLTNVLINPLDFQTFTPNHHNGSNATDFFVPTSQPRSFDWSNDLLVKELSSL